MRLPLMLFGAIAACTHPVEPMGLPTAKLPYDQLHESATRDLQLVVDLETRLLMHATLVDEELAAAQALELSRARLEVPEEWHARSQVAEEEAASSWTIVFSADVPRYPKDERFAADGSAPWTLHLWVDGHPADPISVEAIKAPTADDLMLYPQLNRWSSLWVARFARDGDADELRLQIGGPRGQGELVWAR